jgi:hypothetical protein
MDPTHRRAETERAGIAAGPPTAELRCALHGAGQLAAPAEEAQAAESAGEERERCRKRCRGDLLNAATDREPADQANAASSDG